MAKELTTLFTGRLRMSLQKVTSTSAYLAEYQRTNRLPEGAAVTARYQEQGKGQGNNVWFGEEGKNLLVSYVFW